jgi:Flp pilus assembly protein TadB
MGSRWHARELSMLAGAGLVMFEAAELGWLGFQPLEAIFAVVGIIVVALTWQTRRSRPCPELKTRPAARIR